MEAHDFSRVRLHYFKEINDNFGHDMGDRVLQKLVQILQSNFRENDIIIRMGGDEFSDKMPLSLSTGLYFSENGIDADMLKVVDVGLYHTKKMGRSGCTIINEKEEVVTYWKVN